MRLQDAQEAVREVSGKPYSWLKQWGIGYVGEAVRTIEDRKSATNADRELAADIKIKLWRKW